MSPRVQAKMLRVLEEQRFEPVGSNTPCKVDVRVISATNKALERPDRKRQFSRTIFFIASTSFRFRCRRFANVSKTCRCSSIISIARFSSDNGKATQKHSPRTRSRPSKAFLARKRSRAKEHHRTHHHNELKAQRSLPTICPNLAIARKTGFELSFSVLQGLRPTLINANSSNTSSPNLTEMSAKPPRIWASTAAISIGGCETSVFSKNREQIAKLPNACLRIV